ncbi:MAG: hypothetical protein ACRCYU_01730 [Nocardioides sp.]
MEILWWLAPPVGVGLLAMAWVSWLGRESYGAVAPEVAAKRLALALAKELPQQRPRTRRFVRGGRRSGQSGSGQAGFGRAEAVARQRTNPAARSERPRSSGVAFRANQRPSSHQ